MKYLAKGEFTPRALEIISEARARVYPEPIDLDPTTNPDQADIIFDMEKIHGFPDAVTYMELMFRGIKPVGVIPGNEDSSLYFDIESHSVADRWRMTPREFFRLGQYAWGLDGDVVLTEDYDEMIDAIRSAKVVVGHNIHDFDLSVLFGKDSIEPLEMAVEGKIFDTFTHAILAMPAPDAPYTMRSGRRALADKPEAVAQWLSLDNLSFQLGLPGKIGDLKALAAKYGGFGAIPVDDPEFREYAKQDVHAVRDLSFALLNMHPMTEYDWSEQLSAAIDAQVARNGFRVDTAKASERARVLTERKEVVLKELERDYNFPTEGKSPWTSNPGKEAIFKALADAGVTEETVPTWQRTDKGALSLGGKVLLDITKGTAAEDLGVALAELKGQRTLPQLALASVQPDGKVHPDISALQRSGRRSTTNPGLTVWGAQGEKAVDKAYFVASPGRKLVEMDYSNADQRVVGAYSGDLVFMERVSEDFDAHEMSGRFLFGDDVYDTDPKRYRQQAKPAGHGWAYRAGAAAVARGAKCTLAQADRFIQSMNKRYAGVVAWQNRVSDEGKSGFVTDAWGRRMVVQRARAYTQTPGLMGQGGTSGIMKDGLIRIARSNVGVLRWLVAMVHDAVVWDIPIKELEWAPEFIRGCMETTFYPPGGMPVEFPMSVGTPADDWQQANH